MVNSFAVLILIISCEYSLYEFVRYSTSMKTLHVFIVRLADRRSQGFREGGGVVHCIFPKKVIDVFTAYPPQLTTLNHSHPPSPNKNFTSHSPGGGGALKTYPSKLSPQIFQFLPWGGRAPLHPLARS